MPDLGAEQVGKPLSDLPELLTPTDGDLMYIVDAEASANSASKKITMSNLKRVLGGNVTGTVEGASVSFSDGADGIPMEECEVTIVPTQDLHGYSKPWAGGAGKNKNAYPYVAGTRVISDVSFTMNNDGTITLSGTATAQADYILNGAWASSANILPSGNYKISLGDNIPNGIELICVYNTTRLSPVDNIINAPNGITYTFIRIANGTNTNGIELFPMIYDANYELDQFEPYSNICPISGHTDVTVTVASTSGGSGDDTTVSLGRTVYGGTLDVTTGELTVTKKYATFSDISSWTYDSARTRFQTGHITDMKTVAGSVVNDIITSCTQMYSNNQAWDGHIDGASWTSDDYFYVSLHDYTSVTDLLNAIGNEQIVYPLVTPQTFTLNKEQIQTLLGQNYVSHDGGGNIKVVYIRDLDITINDLIDRVTALENE